MCIAYYHKQPGCNCVYVTGDVNLCQSFTSRSRGESRKFRAKLGTSHCRGLNLLFNNIDYVSGDVESLESDAAPRGLECPDVSLDRDPLPPGPCPLCDSSVVLRYLKLRGIEYPSVADRATRDAQGREAEGTAEAAGGKAAGKSVEGSVGDSVDKAVGISSGNGPSVAGVGRALEVVARAKIRPGVERGRRSPAEPTPDSMGWD